MGISLHFLQADQHPKSDLTEREKQILGRFGFTQLIFPVPPSTLFGLAHNSSLPSWDGELYLYTQEHAVSKSQKQTFISTLEFFSPLLETGKMLHYRGNSWSDVLSRCFEKYCLNVPDISVRLGNSGEVTTDHGIIKVGRDP